MQVRDLAGFVLLAISATAAAQSVPDDLNQFGLICFCNSRVATPHMVVGLDNNGKILGLLRTPRTKTEIIASGQPVLDSQLRVLRDWGLISQDGDKYALAFPAFGPEEMTALRARLAPSADRIAQTSTTELDAIAAELRRRGRMQSAHALLFAYILDGLVWRELESRKALPAQDFTPFHPYWAGTFWAVYPKQDDMPGTNDFTVGAANLRMMWTPQVVHHFSRLVNDTALQAWLRSLDKVPAGSEMPKATSGSPADQLLVVDERSGDPLYVIGTAVARRVTEEVVNLRLDDVVKGADGQQRLVIATHELIWLTLDRMSKTKGFAAPSGAGQADIDYSAIDPLLVVAIRRNKP